MEKQNRLRKEHQLLIGAALIALVGTPLWFDGGREPERLVAQLLESLVLPTATAAAIAPTVVKTPMPASPEQSEAARLLIAGTMLFGLAAVVRRSM
jgi:hypothetical protein